MTSNRELERIDSDDDTFDLEDGYSSFAGRNEMDYNVRGHNSINEEKNVRPPPKSTSANQESAVLMPIFLLE
jgi:hypothetical protein